MIPVFYVFDVTARRPQALLVPVRAGRATPGRREKEGGRKRKRKGEGEEIAQKVVEGGRRERECLQEREWLAGCTWILT